ncbi:MAG: BON domain-containing protein, partial [Burkholderiales bacterium]
QESKPDPDKALAAKVHDALRGSLGSVADGIDVTASGGMVTLWGTVPEAAKRHMAVRAATGVAGVKSVKDNMAIVAGS